MNGSVSANVAGGTAPYSFSWSNGGVTQSLNNLSSGVYDLKITDANGCTSNARAVVEKPSDEVCQSNGPIDLELIKRVNTEVPMAGDTINFSLTVFNNSVVDATGVSLVDYVPSGFVIIEETIDGDGVVSNINTITWSEFDVPALELKRFVFRAIVLEQNDDREYTNIAEITAADQEDLDSTPNNDDGDQSEDDEDSITSMPQMADVAIQKFINNPAPGVREVVLYTIRVTNEGETPLTRVEVTDYLPIDACNNFTNISDGGIYLLDRIIWTDINLEPGESMDLTFNATIASSALGSTVTNRAQVTDMDQTDMDSSPNNDDGDQSEDDESAVNAVVGQNIADLELMKDVDMMTASPNDVVEFSITLVNKGPGTAYGVTVEDILPDGFDHVANVSHNGTMFQDRVVWLVESLKADSMISFTFNATVVHFADRICDYVNVAQISNSYTVDPDATAGNYEEGRELEDDEDTVEVIVDYEAGVCAEINTAILLSGAYNPESGLMNTTLNRIGYLPGQKPKTAFGTFTEQGQPYDTAPWEYNGAEGDNYMFDNVSDSTNAYYPTTAVDWVIVSLRTDESASSTVCRSAALVHADGRIEMIDGFECCNLDPSEDYYIVIEHRNHLIVMSHVQVPIVNGQISYDFRVHNSWIDLFGFGQQQVAPGMYAMYAGNGEQAKSAADAKDINPNDLTKWLEQNGKTSSYFQSDFNLSGDVNVADKSLFLRNNGIFSDVDRE